MITKQKLKKALTGCAIDFTKDGSSLVYHIAERDFDIIVEMLSATQGDTDQ